MTGDYDVMRALVTHAGVALVDTLEELLDVSELMIRWPIPPRDGAAVISDSGAFKAMVLDFCETLRPRPAGALSRDQAVLAALAPGLMLPTNPLDVTAQPLVDPELYRKAMQPMLDDDALWQPGARRRAEQSDREPAQDGSDHRRAAGIGAAKPVMFAMLGEDGEVAPEMIAELRDLGVPFFRSPERALRALGAAGRPARAAASVSRLARRPAGARLPTGVIPEYAAKRILADGWHSGSARRAGDGSRRGAAGSGAHRLSGGA